MTIQTVGAPADSEEDPTKKNVTAPPILKQAEEAIAQNIGAPASDADRERIFSYRAEPFLKQAQKTTENLSKYYEQQGLRFSTERRDMIGEKVGEIGRQMGESVMVPQIEREKADQQAWANLGINLGTTQANIALQAQQQSESVRQFNLTYAAQADQYAKQLNLSTLQFEEVVRANRAGETIEDSRLKQAADQFDRDLNLRLSQLNTEERRLALDEVNAALSRAATQAQATGKFTDPVTGQSFETLAKQAELFGQSIQERQTSLMEVNAAYERAQAHGQATGIFIDPVTGIASDTLDKQRLNLDKIVQRAVATGWWEEEATFEREKLLTAAGADTDNGLGEPPPGSTVPPPAAGEGNDPDTVKDQAKASVEELNFIGNRLPAYQRDTGASMVQLQTVVTELGVADAEALMDRLLSGEPITVGELRNLTLTKHQSAPAWAAIQDMVTAEGTSDTSRVWLPNQPIPTWSSSPALQQASSYVSSGQGVPLSVWDQLSPADQQQVSQLPGFRREMRPGETRGAGGTGQAPPIPGAPAPSPAAPGGLQWTGTQAWTDYALNNYRKIKAEADQGSEDAQYSLRILARQMVAPPT